MHLKIQRLKEKKTYMKDTETGRRRTKKRMVGKEKNTTLRGSLVLYKEIKGTLEARSKWSPK